MDKFILVVLHRIYDNVEIARNIGFVFLHIIVVSAPGCASGCGGAECPVQYKTYFCGEISLKILDTNAAGK